MSELPPVPAPHDSVIHVATQRGTVGPITRKQLLERVASGEIAARDYFWIDGMSAWLPLAQHPGMLEDMIDPSSVRPAPERVSGPSAKSVGVPRPGTGKASSGKPKEAAPPVPPPVAGSPAGWPTVSMPAPPADPEESRTTVVGPEDDDDQPQPTDTMGRAFGDVTAEAVIVDDGQPTPPPILTKPAPPTPPGEDPALLEAFDGARRLAVAVTTRASVTVDVVAAAFVAGAVEKGHVLLDLVHDGPSRLLRFESLDDGARLVVHLTPGTPFSVVLGHGEARGGRVHEPTVEASASPEWGVLQAGAEATGDWRYGLVEMPWGEGEAATADRGYAAERIAQTRPSLRAYLRAGGGISGAAGAFLRRFEAGADARRSRATVVLGELLRTASVLGHGVLALRDGPDHVGATLQGPGEGIDMLRVSVPRQTLEGGSGRYGGPVPVRLVAEVALPVVSPADTSRQQRDLAERLEQGTETEGVGAGVSAGKLVVWIGLDVDADGAGKADAATHLDDAVREAVGKLKAQLGRLLSKE